MLHYFNDDDDLIIAAQTNAYLIHFLSSQKKWGGSTAGRITINRNQLKGDFWLFNDYFSENPVYPEFLFRRRFRMRISFFCKILDDPVKFDNYFVDKRAAAGRLGFSPYQKVTSALRMMAYGCSADSVDEYTRMSESFIYLAGFCWFTIKVTFFWFRWEHVFGVLETILSRNKIDLQWSLSPID